MKSLSIKESLPTVIDELERKVSLNFRASKAEAVENDCLNSFIKSHEIATNTIKEIREMLEQPQRNSG